jgi:hypothetical protein
VNHAQTWSSWTLIIAMLSKRGLPDSGLWNRLMMSFSRPSQFGGTKKKKVTTLQIKCAWGTGQKTVCLDKYEDPGSKHVCTSRTVAECPLLGSPNQVRRGGAGTNTDAAMMRDVSSLHVQSHLRHLAAPHRHGMASSPGGAIGSSSSSLSR